MWTKIKTWVTNLFKDDGRVRITLDASSDVAEQLKALVHLTGAGDRVEVIRRALAVYDHLHGQRVLGCKLIVRFPTGTEQELDLR